MLLKLIQAFGNACFVLAAQIDQLSGGKAFRMLAQIKQAHHMGSLEAEICHFGGFDPNNLLICPCDIGGEFDKAFDHFTHSGIIVDETTKSYD